MFWNNNRLLKKPGVCAVKYRYLSSSPVFGAHRINKDGSWDSEFKRHIEALGIKPILAGVRHPQTNGRIEKWFHTYKRFRCEFETFEELIQ